MYLIDFFCYIVKCDVVYNINLCCLEGRVGLGSVGIEVVFDIYFDRG